MKVTLLGTGTSQGVPVIACPCDVCNSLDFRDKRLRSSIHIEVEGNSFVIDSGPDFRQQMLKENIQQLDALIFTHQHKDHTAGMDDVRAFNFKQKVDIPIYARFEVLEQLKREFAYIFTEKKYPGVADISPQIIKNEPFQINGVELIPIEVLHYKLPVFGFRLKNFTYITDANYISEEELEKVKGSKILIINALMREKHLSHFNLEEALEVIEKIKPETAYLTHISHRMGKQREIEKELPENVFIAYDGLSIHL